MSVGCRIVQISWDDGKGGEGVGGGGHGGSPPFGKGGGDTGGNDKDYLKSHCTHRNLLRRSADDGKRLSIHGHVKGVHIGAQMKMVKLREGTTPVPAQPLFVVGGFILFGLC